MLKEYPRRVIIRHECTSNIGYYFRDERINRKLSLPQVSAVSGIPLNTLRQFEKGIYSDITFTSFLKLLAFYDLWVEVSKPDYHLYNNGTIDE